MLCGTARRAGGYVVGVDVDRGPDAWPAWPRATLYAEAGTAPGRWHLFLAVLDRLDGQRNVYDQSAHLAVEIKGRGYALRSWPTLPADKARGGYRPAFLTEPPGPAPELAVRELAEGLGDYFSRVFGETFTVDGRHRRGGDPPRGHRAGPVSAPLIQAVEDELERRGARLRPPGRGGWRSGHCPFHDDRNPSFGVSFELGAWLCRSGCGSGGLQSLVRRLGLTAPRATATWEIRG